MRERLSAPSRICRLQRIFHRVVNVYHVPLSQQLDDGDATHDMPHLARTIEKPADLDGVLDTVAINGDMVAITIAGEGRAPVLLVNVVTGVQCLMDPACEVRWWLNGYLPR